MWKFIDNLKPIMASKPDVYIEEPLDTLWLPSEAYTKSLVKPTFFCCHHKKYSVVYLSENVAVMALIRGKKLFSIFYIMLKVQIKRLAASFKLLKKILHLNIL